MHYAEWARWMSTFQFTEARIWPYLLINDEIIWLFYNFYQLSDGCFFSGFEMYGGLLNYVDWYSDPTIIRSNLL